MTTAGTEGADVCKRGREWPKAVEHKRTARSGNRRDQLRRGIRFGRASRPRSGIPADDERTIPVSAKGNARIVVRVNVAIRQRASGRERSRLCDCARTFGRRATADRFVLRRDVRRRRGATEELQFFGIRNDTNSHRSGRNLQRGYQTFPYCASESIRSCARVGRGLEKRALFGWCKTYCCKFDRQNRPLQFSFEFFRHAFCDAALRAGRSYVSFLNWRNPRAACHGALEE
jgi:hypothetical protein